MKVYAFDIDETLEVSNGPVTMASVRALADEGHIVGLCGNYGVVTRIVPHWNKYISFIGQMLMTKRDFLTQVGMNLTGTEYVMVGNDPAHYGASNDIEEARAAGWRFIREDEFAAGKR
jgi:hypothetical protein